MTLAQVLRSTAVKAREAYFAVARLSGDDRSDFLNEMQAALKESREAILAANARDLEAAHKSGLSKPLLDRLTLDGKRFDDMLKGLSQIAKQKDPLGEVIETRTLPNLLQLSKVRVPIGVIGMIYESRPNVTCEAAALCFRSGNAVILKGGSEAIHTNREIWKAMQQPLKTHKDLEHAISFIDSTDRSAVQELVKLDGLVDLVIPRGGEGLIASVIEWARVPVIKHAKGVCHTFVDESADVSMALKICENAKCQRPGVCNAMESLLVHENIAEVFLPLCMRKLSEKGVEFRGDEKARAIESSMKVATDADWSTEYLELILSVKIVKDVGEAIAHINTFGSHHSDTIVSQTQHNQTRFLDEIDSAVVYVNASTRFTDGAQFGMGAEIGISTDKLHARGPMGATELTTYKWKAMGSGQTRN